MSNSIVIIATHGDVTCSNLIAEMQRFGKVIVLVDKKQKIEGVEMYMCENKGYDFGKIHSYITNNIQKTLQYDMITITNDTISPVESFQGLYDFTLQSEAGFLGACDGYSSEHTGEYPYGYHLQSFFHVFKGAKAIQDVVSHYICNGVLDDKYDGVRCYETYFTATMLQKGNTIDSYIKVDRIAPKYKRHRMNIRNRVAGIITYDPRGELSPSFEYPVEMLQEGLPFVKNSMFQYHFRPHDLLQHLAHRAYEISTRSIV